MQDVLEDCDVNKKNLIKLFGDDVAEIVDGVSKLSNLDITNRSERDANNLQKMMLAISKDIRVVLVKICDRLHNMRTIEHLPRSKQLEINILSKKPGIFSSRWAGSKGNFNFAIKKIFNELKKKDPNWEKKKILAQFICVLTLYWPSGKYVHSVGKVKGYILNKKRGINGFGYDPVFCPTGFDKSFGEISAIHKNMISHRSIAFIKLKKLIQKF